MERKSTSATPDNDSSFSEASQFRIGNDGGGGTSGIFVDDAHSGSVDALKADAVKRIRMDAAELSKISFVGSSRTVETACQEALRNPLVLHHIFRSFSVKFLLHSCSLVNKPWNTEARKLTRNYRICRASKPKGTNACFSLQQFNQMCSQIKQGGRVIPFNGLKLYIGERCTVNSKGVENGLTNLSSDFELKHLSIMGCLGAVDCEIHNSVMKLLRRRAQGLSTLKIDKQILFGPGKKKWPCFSQLKELDISESFLTEDFDEEDTAKLKKLICAVLENAPNLKRILAEDVETMSIFVPAEKHNLVMPPKRFKFWLERREDIHALQAVSQNGCRLQKLIIAEPFMITTTAGFFQRGVQEPADDNLCRQFHAALEQMLKTCHRNVRRISIKGAYPLASSISLPQLDCLTIFKISKAREGNLAQLWNAIETIDYNRVMPNLKEMKIVVETVHGRWSDATRTFVPDQDGSQIWPTTGRDDHIPCSPSKSVRKLELHLELRKVNLFPLKAVFPSITSLELNVHENGKLGAEIAPFSDIWTCLPDLRKLSIYGSTVSITRNFDADFCGITEQEAEWLRRQPTRFLKKVHIVPIKPCLLTMKNIRKLSIKFLELVSSWKGWDEVGIAVSFLSKVTKLIAFQKMSQVNFILPGAGPIMCTCDDDFEEEGNAGEDSEWEDSYVQQ